MNRFCLFILLFFVVSYVEAQTPAVAAAASGYRIKYDHRALRIPGNKFSIGLVVPAEGKKPADTIGYPGKSGGWGKYHIEVDSGSFSGGKVKLRASKSYKKGDSVTINVYTRKWLLGGRGKLLVSRKIPYDYEDSIRVMTNSNTGRWPGGHVSFGVRTFYDDRQTADLWYPLKKKNSGNFILGFEGGHLSKKKGDWKIDPDPTHIRNDEVKLSARLAKAPAIGDTLGLLLNYTAPFRCGIYSSGEGHELDVSVDAFEDSIIHEKLLKIEVRDSAAHRTYHYLVNSEGGSMSIFSKGADGAKGDDGLSGTDGQSGADGAISQMPVTSTDAQGNTVTTYVDVQGPGGDGGNGSDGADGGNGYAGDNGGNITISYTLAASPYLKLISARSVPGVGGAGGDGGKGGNGGSGGSGAPPGQSGHRGRDGNSGTSGQNGNPGTVRLVEVM